MPWAILADEEKRDTDAIVELIPSQSARVTAVVGGALLDEHVRRILSERLRESSVTNGLLKPDGPLGNLGPKIDLLYLLQATDKPTRHAHSKALGLRNFLAHNLQASFDSQAKEFLDAVDCLTLHASKCYCPDHRYGGDSNVEIESVKDKRAQFIVNVNLKLGLIALRSLSIVLGRLWPTGDQQ
jgi:DNA-binding MltR family transcriptional regulator